MHIFIKYLGISFLCSSVLIFISKVLLDNILRRDIDYYEKDEKKAEDKMLSRIKTIEVRDEEH